ncbi:response regulator transcription factor [Pelagicoccus mobilis]|uniref:Helix-turn-helix transcriptional regulator n=1 Tax=Pelagicoccus mobilis TaxID=415221 RepID=A0A934RSB8_9BACT|nr:helix-turn-helix transcriptional regulator [Pelagicoccus mobilis]MBK1875972.1 helix-turn-helix transcriptional regulator [Pelagicoccus mobilis]
MDRRNESGSMLESSFDGSILSLHAAIDRESLWNGVRDLLAHVCDFKRITLFLGHLGMGDARVVYTEPEIPQPSLWFEQRGELNPFSPWIAEHVGAPYYLFRDIIGTPSEFRKTEFYQRFAKIEGWDKGMSIMFWEGEEMRAMFSLYRGPRQKDFTEEEVQKILSVARHIDIAVARVQRIHRDQNFQNALQSFTRTLPAPLLLLDWRLKLVFANLAAYESAATWNFGKTRARSYNPRECFRIPGPVLEATNELKDRIQAIRPKELDKLMPGPVLVENGKDRKLKAKVSPASFSQSSLARPGFFVLFQEPFDLADDLEPEVLAERKRRALQTLTPAEREIVRHICKGERNAEIAQKLNKSILTVKTQVNSIFQKLGLKSRAQLVARLK